MDLGGGRVGDMVSKADEADEEQGLRCLVIHCSRPSLDFVGIQSVDERDGKHGFAISVWMIGVYGRCAALAPCQVHFLRSVSAFDATSTKCLTFSSSAYQPARPLVRYHRYAPCDTFDLHHRRRLSMKASQKGANANLSLCWKYTSLSRIYSNLDTLGEHPCIF